MLSERKIYNALRMTEENYNRDNGVFRKSIAIIKEYTKRGDWPHSIEKLDNIGENILGNRFIDLTFSIGKYVDDGTADWEGVPEDLKNEYLYFYYSIGEMYNQAWLSRFEPNQYYGIAYTAKDEHINLKIIKNNNENIELDLNKYTLNELIEDLNKIKDDIDGSKEF